MGHSTYRLGDHGTAVGEVRALLRQLDLLARPVGTVDLRDSDLFDRDLDRAVRSFQQRRGVTVDGIVGPVTWRLLEEAHWRLGDRVLAYVPGHLLAGDDVTTLQRRLLDLGFDVGRADGVFGTQTEQAVKEFQRNVGITVDGLCGPLTFRALERLNRTVVGGAPEALREAERIRHRGRLRVVVVDPGHGGLDRGACAPDRPDVDEARLAEDLAARVEGRLAASGVVVHLTRGRLRPGDPPPDDGERAAVANRLDADLVISLHCDASADRLANGVATYYYGNRALGVHSAVGEAFAGLVQDEIVARTGLLDCHTHGKTWGLLRHTVMPAVRIEVGYLTHPQDAARLADPAFRDVVAEAVVAAVQRLAEPRDDDPQVIRLPDLVG